MYTGSAAGGKIVKLVGQLATAESVRYLGKTRYDQLVRYAKSSGLIRTEGDFKRYRPLFEKVVLAVRPDLRRLLASRKGGDSQKAAKMALSQILLRISRRITGETAKPRRSTAPAHSFCFWPLSTDKKQSILDCQGFKSRASKGSQPRLLRGRDQGLHSRHLPSLKNRGLRSR